MKTSISSMVEKILIGEGEPTVVIGERINPTGKERMAAALNKGMFDTVCKEALEQVQSGADSLDINVGMSGVEEETLLPRTIQAVSKTANVPLCIDSANYLALVAALEVYEGKPLINSVTGEERSMKKILPLVKQHGAAVIGLLQNENGIPNNSEERLIIAYKILNEAEKLSIPPKDVIIDCVVQPAGIDTRSALIALETVRKIKEKLQVNTLLAISNISFGLPDRTLINKAFASMAIISGVNCVIADPIKLCPTIRAADLLIGSDSYAKRYTENFRRRYRAK